MSTHRTVATLGLHVASLITACVLISGCAAGGGASPLPTVTAASPAASSGGPTSMDAVMVLRGTMIESVEVNCRIMRVDNSDDTYQLIGLPDDLARPGTRVEVRGELDAGMVSFCMQGPIFKVSSARRI